MPATWYSTILSYNRHKCDRIPVYIPHYSYLDKEVEISVEAAESAHKGLVHLTTHPVDIIIYDYQMPDVDGLVFLKIVREKYHEIPFILFTGRGSEEVIIEALITVRIFFPERRGSQGPVCRVRP
ncbi:MAG: response regulator [Methanomicrobiales archaeon]